MDAFEEASALVKRSYQSDALTKLSHGPVLQAGYSAYASWGMKLQGGMQAAAAEALLSI